MRASINDPRRSPAGCRGFSLIEVLLAVVIAAGLFLAVMLFYRQTADTRATVNAELDALGSARRVMQHLTSELRAAAHPDTGARLSGSQQTLSFATTALPAASPLTDRLTSTGLIRVEYALQFNEDDEPTGLTRSEQSLHPPGAAAEEDEAAIPSRSAHLDPPDAEGEDAAATDDALLLTDQLRFVRFRYWDGDEWADEWSGSQLPLAVQIMLAVEPVAEELTVEEYPSEVFRRTVSLGYTIPEDPDAMNSEDDEADDPSGDDAEAESVDDLFSGGGGG